MSIYLTAKLYTVKKFKEANDRINEQLRIFLVKIMLGSKSCYGKWPWGDLLK